MSAAVTGGQRCGLPDVLDDPSLIVFFFDACGQFDGGHGFTHIGAVVIFQCGFVHHHQRVHLTQVQMCVHEGFRYQVTACIQVSGGFDIKLVGDVCDFPVFDGDIFFGFRVAAQSCITDDQVVLVSHNSPRGIYRNAGCPHPAFLLFSYFTIPASSIPR